MKNEKTNTHGMTRREFLGAVRLGTALSVLSLVSLKFIDELLERSDRQDTKKRDELFETTADKIQRERSIRKHSQIAPSPSAKPEQKPDKNTLRQNF